MRAVHNGRSSSSVRTDLEMGEAVLRVPADLKQWLPGDAVVDDSLYIPGAWRPERIAFESHCSTPELGSRRFVWQLRGDSLTDGMTRVDSGGMMTFEARTATFYAYGY